MRIDGVLSFAKEKRRISEFSRFFPLKRMLTLAFIAQDCQFWLAYLGMQCRLHELRHKRRISVAAASKILSNLVYSYKGMGLSMVRWRLLSYHRLYSGKKKEKKRNI